MEYLLKQLYIIHLKYEMLYENKEKYNIFSVLHKDNDERRLHSRFISSLLAPDSSHGKNNVFLNFFFSIVNIEKDNFDTVEVYPKEWNKKENSNIDILVINRKNRYAIIVENKIYAGDSNNNDGGQLERYYKHVRDIEKIPKKNITTFYLTLDGHEPSDESLGTFKALNNINGHCISYSCEIIKWLEKCLSVVADEPFLRESIIQYKNLVEKMTGNQSDIKQRLEIKSIVGKNKDNMNSAKMLIDNFKHVKWHTVRDFWDNLSNSLNSNGYKVLSIPTDQNVMDITHFEPYRKGQKNKQYCGISFEYVSGIKASITNKSGAFLYWGFEINEKINETLRIRIEKILESNYEYQKNEDNYFWSEFFEKNDDKINLTDFSHNATFNLIREEYQKETIQKMIDKIKIFEDNLKSR